MDKYAELIRTMSEASLTLVRGLNETIRSKELAYDTLLCEHEKLKRDYEQAREEMRGLREFLADY